MANVTWAFSGNRSIRRHAITGEFGSKGKAVCGVIPSPKYGWVQPVNQELYRCSDCVKVLRQRGES